MSMGGVALPEILLQRVSGVLNTRATGLPDSRLAILSWKLVVFAALHRGYSRDVQTNRSAASFSAEL